MARDPFRFSLEPERIVVEGDRDDLRNEVERAETRLAEARATLERRREGLEESKQRIAGFHDEEVRGAGEAYDADLWRARSEYLEGLRAQERARGEAVKAAEADARTARHALENLERRLAEMELRLRALEEERDRQQRAWRREQEKLDEKKRDEDAQLRWSYENRRRRNEEEPG